MKSLESVADICATAIQNAHYVERVKQLAYLDGLTGIFNRRLLRTADHQEELDRARRFNSGMAVIMVDIDQFKRLNDEFGHLLGDEVLRQVSSIFHQQLTEDRCRLPLWRRRVRHPAFADQPATRPGRGREAEADGR